MTAKPFKELHEFSPYARMKMLAEMLWGQIRFSRGEVRRGWDQEFLKREVEWAQSLPNREITNSLPMQPKLYRGEWNIQPDYIGHMWSHKDYDGPEDRRIGNCPTVEACEREIDEWIICDQEKELESLRNEVASLKARLLCTVNITTANVFRGREPYVRAGGRYSKVSVQFGSRQFVFLAAVCVETPNEKIDYQVMQTVAGEIVFDLLPNSYMMVIPGP